MKAARSGGSNKSAPNFRGNFSFGMPIVRSSRIRQAWILPLSSKYVQRSMSSHRIFRVSVKAACRVGTISHARLKTSRTLWTV